MYKLRSGSNADPLPWRIGVTPGIRPSKGEDQIKNILQIVDGHVPEGYEVIAKYPALGGYNKQFLSDNLVVTAVLRKKRQFLRIHKLGCQFKTMV